MVTADVVGSGLGGRGRLAAGVLAVIVGLVVVSGAWAGAGEHAKLSGAERAFAKAYVALLPGLQKTSESVTSAISKAGGDSDAQVVTVFTGLAKQWSAGTKALVALKAPAPDPACSLASRATFALWRAIFSRSRSRGAPTARARPRWPRST
jgi:hypothetical protein